MNLILYSSVENACENEIGVISQAFLQEGEMQIFRSIDSLYSKLLLTRQGDAIAVLFAENIQDLLNLLSIINVLRKARVILILPDNEPETVKIGYKLEPRFLFHAQSSFHSLQAVLEKMS